MWRIALLSLALLGKAALACGCVGMLSSCDRGWAAGDTIFLGRVTAVKPVDDAKPGAFLSTVSARFVVEESFHGNGVSGNELTVYTGSGGGDCGYPFVPGQTYLVYASPGPGDNLLHTSVCTETTPTVRAGGVLGQLRAMRDHQHLPDLFGTVLREPAGSGYGDLVDSQALAGVPVQVTGSSGRSWSATTDQYGAYAFAGLAPGAYQVRAGIPAGLALLPRPGTATVTEGSGCRLDLSAKPDGRIEGMVVDSAGKAMSGFVTIQPSRPEEAAAAVRRGGLPGDEIGRDGKFVLPLLPPGNYRLSFHPATSKGVDFTTTYYWPAPPEESIEISLGQHVTNVRFVVPAK